ncbi:MAG: hypothetical protein EA397_15045 [Deltaproteobacteria bacterium]|nr:MAG: hypothetical protein EA397_15045 [Deltaproteobacteria bacterium]
MWLKIKHFWLRHKSRYAEAVNRYGVPVILTAMALRLIMAAIVLGLFRLGYAFEEQLGTTDAGLFVAAWALVWPLAPVRWILAAVIAPPLVRKIRAWRGLDPDLPPPAEPASEPAESSTGD